MYDEDLTIDISCAKLVDWLVQRRHCNRDWGEKLAIIRRKIRAALQDMPEHEDIKNLLMNSRIDYFKCKQIVEILKHTEADSKNFFGYYSSQRMKDWQDIVYQYEKNCIYLAEIATNLIREVSYEVPNVRRIISKLNKDKEDLEKEKASILKRIQQFTSEYNRLAQSYGIKGENIAAELRDESKCVSSVMNEIAEASKPLAEYLDYYKEISSLTSKQDSSNFLPILNHVIEKGNTTIFELKYQKIPDKIERDEPISSTSSSNNDDEIDFGDSEIDFGEDPPSSESSSGFVHVKDKHLGDESNEKQLESHSDAVARGEEAKLMLESRKIRGDFVNNLHELSSFLIQLSVCNEQADGRTSSIFLEDDMHKLEKYTVVELNQAVARISDLISLVNKERNRMLFQINESNSFIEDIEQKFHTIRKQIDGSKSKVDIVSKQMQDIERQTKENQVYLNKCISLARETQDKVESSIKHLYGGKKINIMGCV